MRTSFVNSTDAPQAVGGYAQAVAVDGARKLLFISGQIPVDRAGHVPASFSDQARLAWCNLEAQLRAAGMSLDNLVKVTVFLADRRYGLERYMKETHRLYGVFNKRLGDVQFAGGNDVSIADFAILGWAWRHERHQVDLADYPNVKRWYEAMMARPGTKRGFEVALS